ncbi:CGCGG family rSAM-modified RiPP protein [Anaerobacillus sp. CMMVII]|uniref:CGCGG family putative rSAM-modified RiPP protein n=1 Tax=Anaerobacillus sp. CMMVII TaxID=2755588 RepID=UPI0021B849B9|nr:CGCGG family rSAM-modified RiPP protein [Anaerobacillus sp. CMMVII]MCT8139458.1 CGCGG family rSAM-modified RiPP protein [Anaerobacillus sp. CMMVII]
MKMKSWSCALEHGEYETNRDLVIAEALEAVAETAKGFHVNLVTPHTFGNPDEYLTPLLKEKFYDEIDVKYIDQCGCGGYVLRVEVMAP